MKASRFFTAIAVLSAIGIVVSSLSLYHHFGTDQSSYCDFGQAFNCDIVNRSIYSTIMGIPVALIGVVGYLGLLGLVTVRRARRETPLLLMCAAFAGLSFALYLTYVEKFILGVWCILCLTSLGMITGIALLSAMLLRQTNRI